MALKIVNADLSHSRNIWDWRNDPISRSFSRKTNLVEWNDHDAWFRKSLKNKERFLYLGINEEPPHEIPIGIIRFDLVDFVRKHYEVSINIAPNARGKGLGHALLKSGTNKFLKDIDMRQCIRIYASVKLDNFASIRLFTSAGYFPCDSNGTDFGEYFINIS